MVLKCLKDAVVWLEIEWAVHVWCASTSWCFIFFGIFQASAIQNPISAIVQANLPSRARNLQQAFNSLSPLFLGVLDLFGCFSILVLQVVKVCKKVLRAWKTEESRACQPLIIIVMHVGLICFDFRGWLEFAVYAWSDLVCISRCFMFIHFLGVFGFLIPKAIQ